MSTTTEPRRAPNLIRLKEVMKRTGLAKTTVYERMRAGDFPKPVHLGTISAWVEDEVAAWIGDRIAERDKAA
jgi:prophage regulatory protein